MFFNDKKVNAHTLGGLFILSGVVDNLVEETEKTARAVKDLTDQVACLEDQTMRDTEWREEYAKLAEEARVSLAPPLCTADSSWTVSLPSLH